MIDKMELNYFSEKLGIDVQVIEKDYVLSWILAGINNHNSLKKLWIFKGGTCLKKCYFETYRFSEDLDFTLTDSSHISMEFLNQIFQEVASWIEERSGIEIPKDSISFDIHPNPAKKYVEGKIGYIGPRKFRPRTNVAKIKLDLSANEILVKEPVQRDVYHPYSDKLNDGIFAFCYSYEELFAEKIRAMAERLRPRDLYDVIHLYRHQNFLTDRNELFLILKEKCDFKKIPIPTFNSIENHPNRTALAPDWENMLRHQLSNLPILEVFWTELSIFFHWLNNE